MLTFPYDLFTRWWKPSYSACNWISESAFSAAACAIRRGFTSARGILLILNQLSSFGMPGQLDSAGTAPFQDASPGKPW